MKNLWRSIVSSWAAGVLFTAFFAPRLEAAEETPRTNVVFSDHRQEKPGTIHKITPSDLPAPFATKSVDNGPKLVDRPSDAWPQAPAGFKVGLYASQLDEPRL